MSFTDLCNLSKNLVCSKKLESPSPSASLAEKDSQVEEMEEDIQSHQDTYMSSGDEADHNEGAAPSQEEANDMLMNAPSQEEADDMSMNLNSLDADDKDGLKSPFEQTGIISGLFVLYKIQNLAWKWTVWIMEFGVSRRI